MSKCMPTPLIWVTMQKNFYASFIQARAYDKRYKHDGEKCMEVARVALDNEDYDNALKIYRYVIREFRQTPNYLLARLGMIRPEARVRKTYPAKRFGEDPDRRLQQFYQDVS